MVMQVKFDVLEAFAAAVDHLVLTTLWDQVQKRLERRFNRGVRMESSKIAPALRLSSIHATA